MIGFLLRLELRILTLLFDPAATARHAKTPATP